MPGGRIAEAARNDAKILESARAVFVADPEAPIAAVAKHAGVGIGALYRRYAGKEELLRALCADGLRRYIEAAEAALAEERDPWAAFAAFMHREVDADASSLTSRLAGTFTPTPELYEAAARAGELNVAIFSRAQEAGAIRPDASVNDLGPILEQLASLKIGDAARAKALRHRYLDVVLDGLRAPGTGLSAQPPTDEELQARWRPR
jgi:AcrR family transcriptional regulator